jgi:hypothetical protein
VELRDLIVTPIVIFLVYVGAYLVRPYVTDEVNRRYFLPALTVRIIGALAVGFLYQFYYGGGDTFNYHTHGSRHIWEAFVDDPTKGFKLLFSDGTDQVGVYRYSSRIIFFGDHESYAVIRLAAVFDLLTFSSYSATAVLFAVVGFAGLWLFFITFYQMNPALHRWVALAVLFLPSVIFWGSGLLKDTLTLACVGMATYATFKLFIQRRFYPGTVILLLVALYVLYSIKIYILLTFLPAAIVWVFMYYFSQIRSAALKVMLFPFFLVTTVVLGYFAMLKAGEDNPKYSLKSLAKTAQVTAYDIRYWTGRDAGSGYTLGELDGTWQSMIRLGPQAINVSLFRPYLWEVRNPLMLLSAGESLALLFLTLLTIYRARSYLFTALSDPTILFCIVFSLTFAFAVGISTYNFGTLTRYKIPLLPFYSLALILIYYYPKRDRNEDVLEMTE